MAGLRLGVGSAALDTMNRSNSPVEVHHRFFRSLSHKVGASWRPRRVERFWMSLRETRLAGEVYIGTEGRCGLNGGS